MNKKFIRAIIVCLVLVLTFQMTGMLEIVAYAADTDDESAAEVSTEPMIVGEDIGRREETVKHYRMSDGSYVAVSYGAPVHYQDSEGLWQDINNIPIMATAGSGADVYRIANAENVADFAASLADGHLLTASCQEMAVSMSLLDMGQAMALTGEAQAMVISEDLTETGFTFNRNVVAQTEGNNTTMMALATEEGVPDEDFIPELMIFIPHMFIRNIQRVHFIKAHSCIRATTAIICPLHI